mgnify:CR=1 FL=1
MKNKELIETIEKLEQQLTEAKEALKQEEEKIDGEKAEEYTHEAKEHYYDALA